LASFLVLYAAHLHFICHHPYTHDENYTNALDNLGTRALLQSTPSSAARYFRASLHEKGRTQHPTTLHSTINLAQALCLQAKYKQAERVLRKGIEKYRACHEKRLEAVWTLGCVVEQLGRVDEALTLFCCAWISAKTVLGEEDLWTEKYGIDYSRLRGQRGVEG
jgi:tetratricopeptide (TPR) repeat protein